MDVFGAIRGHLFKANRPDVDNNAFRLHYRLTTWLLIAFSLLVTSRQYIGDPIECLSPSSAIPANIIDQYCWISTTFTLPAIGGGRIGVDVPHAGVDTWSDGQPRVHHQYYQWVCFVLFLQALMFYVPHYLWKMWEGGRMRALAGGMDIVLLEPPMTKVEEVAGYLRKNMGRNSFYLLKHVLCELLNFANVVGQIYFTDRFLGGSFVTYGVDVIRYSETNQELRSDPMVEVFPRVTKCVFHTFGPSGDVQKLDSLCVLPINIINEKIYIFLWFWFVLVAVVSGCAVLYRGLVLAIPRLRCLLLKSRSRFSSADDVERVNGLCGVGDWFVVYQLAKSIDGRCFAKIMTQLAEKNGRKCEA